MTLKIKRALLIMVTILVGLALVLLIVWQTQGNVKSENENGKQSAAQSGGLLNLENSMINRPVRGIRVDSLDIAEKKAGFSPKANIPKRLFGKNAQIFLSDMVAPNGLRSITFVYTDKANPTQAEAALNIAWRDPGLASYEQTVEQGQKSGRPYTLREHKGHPGFTLEKGVNRFLDGTTEPRHAVVVWMDGEFQYSLYGPIGMGLDELIPIADSID